MFRALVFTAVMFCGPVHAAQFNWANTCTIWHSNPDNRRDPTFVWDTTQTPPGQCNGYDGTPYVFSPCNNIVGSWATVPVDQFGIGKAAKEVRATGRVNVAGGSLYLYTRAPGSMWFHSNNLTFNWDDNVSFTMPVANGAVEYMLTRVGAGPTSYTVNFIIDGWCE